MKDSCVNHVIEDDAWVSNQRSPDGARFCVDAMRERVESWVADPSSVQNWSRVARYGQESRSIFRFRAAGDSPMQKKITFLICDDHAMFREGVKTI